MFQGSRIVILWGILSISVGAFQVNQYVSRQRFHEVSSPLHSQHRRSKRKYVPQLNVVTSPTDTKQEEDEITIVEEVGDYRRHDPLRAAIGGQIQQSITVVQDIMYEFVSQKAESLTTRTKRREVTEQEEQTRIRCDAISLCLSTIPSIIAFLAWEDISHALALFLDNYGAAGRNVDGGQFTVTLLRPTITGVVVPVISIALATLASTTVNVLRARQVDLRALINKEACELRLLRRAILGMFGTRQHASRRAKALALLCGYVEQLECESTVGAIEILEELQLSGGISINELDRISEMLHGVDGAAASRQGSVGVAEGLILSLNRHRSDRVALLLSVFPVIHWGVLIALSGSICFTFLLNSNQQVLQYLNSIQLRTLFAILVGVFAGTAALCINLADPFTGTFSLSESATQLEDLRICLQQDVLEATKEEGEINSKVVHALLLGGYDNGEDYKGYIARNPALLEQSRRASESLISSGVTLSPELALELAQTVGAGNSTAIPTLDRKKDIRRRYGLSSTIYFHLLTGPFGSNARALGDLVAWVATYVGSWTRTCSSHIIRLSSRIRRRLPKTLRQKFSTQKEVYSRS